MCSSLACPHFGPALRLDSMLTKKSDLIPQRLWVHVQMLSSVACPHSFALNLTPMKKWNSRNAQDVLMLSKWLQCGTGRYCLLLRSSNQIVHIISLPVLSHQVQDLCIHGPSDCWVISGFFSAACVIINTPMAMHNQHSSRKANRKVKCRARPHHRRFGSQVNRKFKFKSRPRHHRRILGLPPPRRPRHILLLILVLPRQVQRDRSHCPFQYCGLVSCFFSAVHLPYTPIVFT
ncbi:hypothetical protein EDB19DRAFT_181200 [Suillus lakei]|nr:hypothetical protein EDB19DRAFT_181200 [Suillus lakei]